MGFIRNIFALIGLVTVILLGVLYVKYSENIMAFDAEAGRVFLELAEQTLEKQNVAEASIWKIPVDEGLSARRIALDWL